MENLQLEIKFVMVCFFKRLLNTRIGELYVGSLPTPFSRMKVTKAISNLNNKIIECRYENGQWVFLRERTDKSFPNAFSTAKGNYKINQ